MDLQFSWIEHRGRLYPGCESLARDRPLSLLCDFLVDDGGLGLEHHIPWLKECIAKCEKVLREVSPTDDFTTELFAADFGQDRTLIYPTTSDPESGQDIQTAIFLRIVSDWVAFLERESSAEVVTYSYRA